MIGKGGSYIKIIKDDSGAFVQISVKTSDLAERIVTIEGSSDKRHRALKMVVEKMSQDPQHNSVTTLTYPTSASSSYDDRSTTEKNNISNSLSIGNNVTQLGNLSKFHRQDFSFQFQRFFISWFKQFEYVNYEQWWLVSNDS